MDYFAFWLVKVNPRCGFSKAKDWSNVINFGILFTAALMNCNLRTGIFSNRFPIVTLVPRCLATLLWTTIDPDWWSHCNLVPTFKDVAAFIRCLTWSSKCGSASPSCFVTIVNEDDKVARECKASPRNPNDSNWLLGRLEKSTNLLVAFLFPRE